MKIYALLTSLPYMSKNKIGGDIKNELDVYKILSQFADVYYNNQLLDFNDTKYYGTNPDAILEKPNEGYDYYYIRNNPKILKHIKGKILYYTIPYNPECMKKSYAVVFQTKSWLDAVERKDYEYLQGIYPNDSYFPDKKILFSQYTKPENNKNHSRTLKFRKKFDADFIIGHFGRLRKFNYPHKFMSIFDDLVKNNPNIKIKLVVAGNIDIPIEHPNCEIYDKFLIEDMKYVTSACDIVINEYREKALNFGGSCRIKDCLSSGVPMLLPRADERENEFGKDYELFYSEPVELLNKIQMLISNKNKMKEISEKIFKQAEIISYEKTIINYKKQLL